MKKFIIIAIIIVTILVGVIILLNSNNRNEENEVASVSKKEQDSIFEIGSYFYELQADEETIYFVGYTFNEDGTVVGMLGGESGVLEGKYSILNNKTIKCTFTTYSNDSVAILNQKLDIEGEIILNMINPYTLECKEWTKKPMLDGEDFSFGENQTFNQFNDE